MAAAQGSDANFFNGSGDAPAPRVGAPRYPAAHRARHLAAIDLRKSHVVEMRYFGGSSIEETAVALGVSSRAQKYLTHDA